jgi:mono/diheme cytochrome c family protein/PAS domain-containing protein
MRFLCIFLAALPLTAATPINQAAFDQTVQPFLAKNCIGCHNAKLKTSDLDLQSFKTVESVADANPAWTKILQKIRSGEMPPKGMPRPDPTQITQVAKWIENEFDREDKLIKPDPGRITARRLNRSEYNNTVRDLLGVDFHPADDFPQDDSAYGFDDIAEVLSLSPVLMEKYMVAAEKIAHIALFGPPPMKPLVERDQPPYRDYELSQKPESDYDLTGLSMPQSLHWMHRFPVEGEYLIRIVPEGRRPTGSEPIEMGVWLDGKLVKTLSVDAPIEGNTQDLFGQAREFRMRIPAGEHWIAGSVLHIYEGLPKSYGGPNPSSRPEPPVPDISRFLKIPPDATPEQAAKLRKDAQLKIALLRAPANRSYIHYIEVMGPYNQALGASEESLRKIYVCGSPSTKPAPGCDRKIVANLARQAFRRPVTQQDIEPYVKLVALTQQQGGTFANGIETALVALLVSPDFLFRIEKDRPAQKTAKTDAEPVTQYELASRLSYFLWSSMPDNDLLRAADLGTLRKPEVLEAQVRRMLKDPRSNALIENFAGQWLELRRLESVTPDRDKFPQFEEYLRISMRRESDLFFQSIMRDDRSILDLIDGRYTFLNQRLAEFYGIPNVKGPEFRKVDLTGTHRGGILTQASVLTVSSYATRTSPVLRGKWVLENLLNAPPPPPPANVPPLEEAKAGTSASLRQVMEAHRANALCASCHSKMDPLGFGLENFNAIGEWRDKDGKFPIDSSGVLPDGRTFQGPDELKTILRANKDAFAECMTEKMLTYALGRGVERFDRPAEKEITARLAANDYRFSTLVMGIVESMPFQMRRTRANEYRSSK